MLTDGYSAPATSPIERSCPYTYDQAVTTQERVMVS